MKRLLMLFLLTLLVVPLCSAQELALLVFYRPNRYYGNALAPSVYVDGNQIARLDNGRFFSLYVSPGNHEISSSTKKEPPLELDLKPGETTYLEMVIEAGTWRGGGRLVPAPATDASKALSKLNPLDKHRIVDNRVTFEIQQNTPAGSQEKTTGSQANATAQLVIQSAPDGAEIDIDGAFVGTTPSTIDGALGDHVVVMKKPGYKPWQRTIRVTGGKVSIAAELEAEPK